MMVDAEGLRAKLARVEALFRSAGTPGERAAAEAATGRLRGRRGGPGTRRVPETEIRFTLPDTRSVRLFVAVCRKHGVHPFRCKRQRRTTVMVRARERHFDRVVWPEYSRRQHELETCFEDVTDHPITRVMGSDGDDSALDR